MFQLYINIFMLREGHKFSGFSGKKYRPYLGKQELSKSRLVPRPVSENIDITLKAVFGSGGAITPLYMYGGQRTGSVSNFFLLLYLCCMCMDPKASQQVFLPVNPYLWEGHKFCVR